MDMESQKILFALSTPMEIRNECCLPSHSSPKMYLGTCFFDLSSSWGIDDRGNDSNLLIVFYVQIMPDDFVMQLHRF